LKTSIFVFRIKAGLLISWVSQLFTEARRLVGVWRGV